MNRELYDTYVQILKDELLPAMGCTEPVAVAYAGALAREALGKLPETGGNRSQQEHCEECKKCCGTQHRRTEGAWRPRQPSALWPEIPRDSWRYSRKLRKSRLKRQRST